MEGFTLGFYAAVTPGPLQAFLLSRTIQYGWRRTIPAAFAPIFSDGPILLLVLLILTQVPDWFLTNLRLFGGLFLIYLGSSGLLRARKFGSDPIITPRVSSGTLIEASLMNLLNPNPYIFWSLVGGPILVEGWKQSPWIGLLFLLGFYFTMISGSAGFVIITHSARRLGSSFINTLGWISGLVLIVFGVYQIISVISTFL